MASDNIRRFMQNEVTTNPKSTNNNLRIQVMSDLHIEFLQGRVPNIPQKAPYIALLGDIGLLNDGGFPKYKAFILDLASKFEKVLVLLGNHEFYGASVEEVWKRAEEVCSEKDNIILMNKKSIKLNGVRILGTTLWSHVPPQEEQGVLRSLNDYHMIVLKGEEGKIRKLHVKDTNSWFKTEVEWLQQEIIKAKEQNETVLVLTHHSPILDGSDPKYDDSPINSAFCSDVEYLLGPPVKVWVYGHTHYVQDIVRKGTRVISNSCGYPTERLPWNPELVVELKELQKPL